MPGASMETIRNASLRPFSIAREDLASIAREDPE